MDDLELAMLVAVEDAARKVLGDGLHSDAGLALSMRLRDLSVYRATRCDQPASPTATPMPPHQPMVTAPLMTQPIPRPHGCICPPGAEAGCRGWQCPRRMPTTPGGWSNG